MSKLEVRIMMRWVSTDSTQNTFPAFVDSESPNRDLLVGRFSERSVRNDGVFPRA